MRKGWVVVSLASILAGFAAAFGGCATARRTTDLVVEHHVGMVRGAADIISGAGEEREKRLSKLLEERDKSREHLQAESDPARLAELLREHVRVQDLIIAELMAGGHALQHRDCPHHETGYRGCPHHEAGGGHNCPHHEAGWHARGPEEGEVTSDISALVWKASSAADHHKIANYYLREAKELRLRAAQHRALAERYLGLAPTIDAREQAGHCDELAASFAESAKRFEELASYHRKIAARSPNGS